MRRKKQRREKLNTTQNKYYTTDYGILQELINYPAKNNNLPALCVIHSFPDEKPLPLPLIILIVFIIIVGVIVRHLVRLAVPFGENMLANNRSHMSRA